MRQQIDLGAAPPKEDCAQTADDDYAERAPEECRRYIELIRRKLGPEPPGASLLTESFPHEFRDYFEAVVRYDPDAAEAAAYAHACQAHGPLDWRDDEPYDWRACLDTMPGASHGERPRPTPDTIETAAPF